VAGNVPGKIIRMGTTEFTEKYRYFFDFINFFKSLAAQKVLRELRVPRAKYLI